LESDSEEAVSSER